MTPVVLTVRMVVAGRTTLMTMCNNVRTNPLTQSFIKNKVLTNELVLKSLSLDILGVLNDTAFELEDVFKAEVFHPRTGFLASDTTGAIHQQVFILLIAHQVFGNLKFFPESIYVRANRSFETSDFTFIVIPHINDKG